MKNIHDFLKMSSAEMAAYWRDKSHKKERRQPLVLMSAPKPLAVTIDDPIVTASVNQAVAELLASKSGESVRPSGWMGARGGNWLCSQLSEDIFVPTEGLLN